MTNPAMKNRSQDRYFMQTANEQEVEAFNSCKCWIFASSGAKYL
jgi:hypothetical protein